jgi:L-iditol 2-dehydrogenase
MAETMKAVVWDGDTWPNGMELKDVPRPKANPGGVVVEVKATGICGSDLHYFMGFTRHLIPDENLPAIFGHETAGVVHEVGEGVSGIEVGDRVGIEPLISCLDVEPDNPCPMCQIGQFQLCQKNFNIVGIPIGKGTFNGGYAEFLTVPAAHVFKLPPHVSFEEASLLDTLACAVHASNLGGPQPGDTVAVIGAGIIGLDTLQCLRAAGVTDLIAVAKYDFQAKLAPEFGATEVICLQETGDPVEEVMKLTGGWGADQVYECVGGNTDALQQGLAMCRQKGKLIMEGFFSGDRPLNLATLLLKEVVILPSMIYSYHGPKREFQIALDMVASGQAQQASTITHRFPLEGWKEALTTAIDKEKYGSMKVTFSF